MLSSLVEEIETKFFGGKIETPSMDKRGFIKETYLYMKANENKKIVEFT